MADQEIKYLDKRTIQRYLARGTVSEKDWEKHIKSLPDLADKATTVETQQPETGSTNSR